jgi:7-carboxy-7-deazaguanine synthase
MRLSEIYTSVQGEGPDIGQLTQFIRFAGCNLRCPGWPCDTQHAIDPAKYRHEWETVDPYNIYGSLNHNLKHATLTGGEPFLQKEQELSALTQVYMTQWKINIFTNGTLEWPEWVRQHRITMIMDWKLPGSGEGDVGHEMRLHNLGHLGNKDAVKFVCADEADFIEAQRVIDAYPELFNYPQLYVGAAWGKVEEKQVVEWMKKTDIPFKLNVQVHNHIFNRDDREI